MEEPKLKPTYVKRIGGYLHKVTPIIDGTGKIVQTVVAPLMIELRPKDILQIILIQTFHPNIFNGLGKNMKRSGRFTLNRVWMKWIYTKLANKPLIQNQFIAEFVWFRSFESLGHAFFL